MPQRMQFRPTGRIRNNNYRGKKDVSVYQQPGFTYVSEKRKKPLYQSGKSEGRKRKGRNGSRKSWPWQKRFSLYGEDRAGETRVLAEMEGPGVIQHIWMTVTDRTEKDYYVLRDLVLRIYWDDEEEPSVESRWEIFSAVVLQGAVW